MQSFTTLPGFVFGISLLAFLAAIIIIVFVHEMGHFLMGRWCGVKVEAFSLGFGREIWGMTDRHGTRWKFGWLPLGGYVRFEGDANAASLPTVISNAPRTSLPGAPLWARSLIVMAGPAANFLLAIAIFSSVFMFLGVPVTDPRVSEVLPASAAELAGLKAGDLITAIDGQKITSFSDIQDALVLRGTEPVAFTIMRDTQQLAFSITPKMVETDDGLGSKIRVAQVGIKSDGKFTVVRSGPIEAVAKGTERTWFIVTTTLRYVGKIFLGTESSNQLHGPVGMAKVAGDTAMLGIWPFVFYIGLISVSVGLINLFPIPILDGGHLVFYLIEAVIGRPVSASAQEWSFRIGLSAILVLMVIVSTKDIFMVFTH